MTTSLRVCAILYRLRINTHVLTLTMPCIIDCFIARHGGRLSSKEEYLCFTVPIAGLSAGGAGPSQTPSIATTATSSPCGNNVCSSEKVYCGSARSTAGDGGSSDTRTTHRLYHSITRENIDLVSGSQRAVTLAHCVG